MPEPHDSFLKLLGRIEATKPQNVSSVANQGFNQERDDLDRKKQETVIAELAQNIKERKKYASLYFYLACSWVVVISVLLVFEGLSWPHHFHLQDSILLAAIGSTTANILGILYVVANYLFKKTDLLGD